MRHRHFREDGPGFFPAHRGDELSLGARLGLGEHLGGLFGIQRGEDRLLFLARELLQGVGEVLAGQVADLFAGNRERHDIRAGGVFQRERLNVAPGDELIPVPFQPAQAPLAQEAVEGGVHMDNDHPALGIEELDIVHDLRAPAIHVENGAAHQVVVEEQPALLIDKRRIRRAVLVWRDENRVVIDFDHLVPGNELIRMAAAVLDVQPHRVRIGLGEVHHEVGQLPDLPVELAGADPATDQLREEDELEGLVGRGGSHGLSGGRITHVRARCQN